MKDYPIIFINKLKTVKNSFGLVGSQPAVKVIFISLFICAFLIGAFLAFYEGFRFLNSLENIGLIIIERLFYLFFMGLFFMLIFSNIIVSYSTIYRADDLRLLFCLPLKSPAIFCIKFFESVVLSSWAFLFILLPFLVAYGIFRKVEFVFYLVATAVFLPFLVLSASIGAMISLLVVRFFNKIKKKLLVFLLMIIAAVIGAFYLRYRISQQYFSTTTFIINQLIPNFEFAQNPILPNFWLVESIVSVTRGDFSKTTFFALLLLSNCLFFFMLSLYLAKKIYYLGWINLDSPQRTKTFPLASSILEKMRPIFAFLRQEDRALVIKDLKMFWRDPLQRTQFLIFFGLLAIYFGNLGNLSYHLLPIEWKNAVSFLNLFATTLVLASLSVRFVFPQLSLEARTFWILGLTPVSFKKLIWEKFWLSLIISLCITEFLVILSNVMLKASLWMSLFSMAVVFVVSFGLMGLACGLGALWPNFREDNPAVIVSGFGGTMNLILALAYLGFVLSLLAIPLHLFVNKYINFNNLKFILSISGIIILITSLITCFLPLWLGARNLKRAEF
ncbi:MAG: hypothetical protein V1674_06400 [Candidatus Omnitrophota bacterium]